VGQRIHASLFGILYPRELTPSIPELTVQNPDHTGQAGLFGLPTRIDFRHAEDCKKALNWLAFFLF
jgi:hypothetical protein